MRVFRGLIPFNFIYEGIQVSCYTEPILNLALKEASFPLLPLWSFSADTSFGAHMGREVPECFPGPPLMLTQLQQATCRNQILEICT